MSDVRDNDVRDDVDKVGKFNPSGHVEGYKQSPGMIRFVFFFSFFIF